VLGHSAFASVCARVLYNDTKIIWLWWLMTGMSKEQLWNENDSTKRKYSQTPPF